MTIEWTDEAIDAAWKAYFWQAKDLDSDWKSHMRRTLDAAVKAQGLDTVSYIACQNMIEHGRKKGRKEALEEAAKVMEGRVSTDDDWDHSFWDAACLQGAFAIRALIEPEVKK